MPQLYPYRIFISHAWSYNEEYYRLVRLFDESPNFEYRNYSVPEHDPLETKQRLASKLLDQLNPVQVVVILAGMYAAHSDWIKFEIENARRMGKPIVGVKPWGQERVPQIVQDNSAAIHGFNAAPIVASIRQLA
jgi:MTH538 TIR-like domain (DUF1863)